MERSDTQPIAEIPVLPPRPALNPEVSDDESIGDRMMRMIISLRTELHELHAKCKVMEEENLVLKKKIVLKPIRITKTEEEDKDAVCSSTGEGAQPVLGGDESNGTQTLTLPVAEADCGEADESVVSTPPRRTLNSPTPV